jgi:endonuclease-3 related protein
LFVEFLDHDYGGSLERMFAMPTAELREKLLALHGVGPETADSILLYAGNHPVFVVDAYTRRVFSRHRLIVQKADCEEIRQLVESALVGIALPDGKSTPNQGNYANHGAAHTASAVSATPRPARVQVLNEMHALIVGVGKNFCLKSEARCEGCPLKHFPHDRRR